MTINITVEEAALLIELLRVGGNVESETELWSSDDFDNVACDGDCSKCEYEPDDAEEPSQSDDTYGERLSNALNLLIKVIKGTEG